MAISPEMLNETFLAEVDYFEDYIDKKLSSDKSYSFRNYITLDIPSGMSQKHFKILKARYEEVGWKEVSWVSDQRDGDFLKFEAVK